MKAGLVDERKRAICRRYKAVDGRRQPGKEETQVHNGRKVGVASPDVTHVRAL